LTQLPSIEDRPMIWLESLLAAVLVAVGDQVSKAVVLARCPPVAATAPRPFVAIRCLHNPRGALARFVGARALLVLWMAAVAAAALALAYGLPGHAVLAPIGIGAIIGGAGGNVLDRLRRGAIVDFIAVGPWPVFNLADAAIVAGVGLVLISLH
jgi:signal peptidase II